MADLSNLIPLTHEDAIKALKKGEILVDGKQSYDIAHYHYYHGGILSSDSYYDLEGDGKEIEESELPQLYRIGKGTFGSTGMETWDNSDKKLKKMITGLLDSGKYSNLIKIFHYDGLKALIVQIANDRISPFTKEMAENMLDQIEKNILENDTPKKNKENNLSASFKKTSKPKKEKNMKTRKTMTKTVRAKPKPKAQTKAKQKGKQRPKSK